jgi:hypothetical protein
VTTQTVSASAPSQDSLTASGKKISCACCGRAFVSRRLDGYALTCSSACRQKLYRRRHQSSIPPSPVTSSVTPPVTPRPVTPAGDLFGQVVELRPAKRQKGSSETFLDSAFERFWQTYPRKAGKQAALRAFARAVTKQHVDPAQIISAAARYAAERAGEDPTYTKHPATWLNAGCWDDEPDTGTTIIDEGGNFISTARTSSNKNQSYLDVAAQMFRAKQ